MKPGVWASGDLGVHRGIGPLYPGAQPHRWKGLGRNRHNSLHSQFSQGLDFFFFQVVLGRLSRELRTRDNTAVSSSATMYIISKMPWIHPELTLHTVKQANHNLMRREKEEMPTPR